MKISIDKKKDEIIFIPEKPIDYFHCGLIHGKISSVTIIAVDTDNPEPRLTSLKISKDTLIKELKKTSRLP